MARLNETDLNKVCRTCLSLSECTKSLYEASSSSTLVCLADILMSFTPLKCYAHDGLPAQICDQCTSELNRFQTFQTKCLESDGILRNPVDIVKIEEINNFDELPVDPLNITELEQLNSNAMIISDNNIATKSLTKPLTNKEIEKELKKGIDVIKHEINTIVKSEIEDGIETNQIRNENREYSCTFCDCSFDRKEQLTVHIATHAVKRFYSCTICDSSFKLKSSLDIHMRRHTCEILYACTVCNRKYRRISILKAHMRTHTEEKSYSCTICDCRFHHKISLKTHMWKHTRH